MDVKDFRPASRPDRLGERDVHLWRVDLAPPEERVAPLRSLLEPEEVERSERFRFDVHRRRFIVRRGRLRQLVGAYLGLEPARVRFVYGPKGKPSIEPSQLAAAGLEGLELNLSDSADLAVYAFTRGLELGVDVEVLKPMPDALGISESFFATEEREVLREVPEERRSEAFFNCWTRKEAYIKAIGEGLSEPLDRFCVTLAPGDRARFLHIGGSRDEASAWSLLHFVPTPGAVGALAFRDEERPVAPHAWADD